MIGLTWLVNFDPIDLAWACMDASSQEGCYTYWMVDSNNHIKPRFKHLGMNWLCSYIVEIQPLECQPPERGNNFLKCLLKGFPYALYKDMGIIWTCVSRRSLSLQQSLFFLESSSLFVKFQILEPLVASAQKKIGFLLTREPKCQCSPIEHMVKVCSGEDPFWHAVNKLILGVVAPFKSRERDEEEFYQSFLKDNYESDGVLINLPSILRMHMEKAEAHIQICSLSPKL